MLDYLVHRRIQKPELTEPLLLLFGNFMFIVIVLIRFIIIEWFMDRLLIGRSIVAYAGLEDTEARADGAIAASIW
jgi:hypothetical protein